MRRVLVALTAVLALSLVFGAGAQAKCGIGCLNHRVVKLSKRLVRAENKISSLKTTVSQQGQAIAAQGQTISAQGQAINNLSLVSKKVDTLYECLYEVPVTQYGWPEEEEGYLYEFEEETFPTTALDVPYEGEYVGAWFLIDGCNPTETAGVRAAKALAPTANLRTLLQPERRLFP